MAEFTPITMKRKRDNATRKVTTAAEQVAAAFDGFAAPATKAPAAKKTAAKTAAKNTGGASKTASAGGPVAKTATAKVAAPAAPSTK